MMECDRRPGGDRRPRGGGLFFGALLVLAGTALLLTAALFSAACAGYVNFFLPYFFGVDVRHLTIRIKRPPRAAPAPEAEAVANVAPRPPLVSGPTREASPAGKPAPISYPRRARRHASDASPCS